MDQLLFSMAEAAGILGIAEPTLRDLVNEGAIQFVQLRYDRGDVRFSRSDLEGFVTGLPRRRRGKTSRLSIVTNAVTNGDHGQEQLTASGTVPTVKPVRYDPADEEFGAGSS